LEIQTQLSTVPRPDNPAPQTLVEVEVEVLPVILAATCISAMTVFLKERMAVLVEAAL
jgi:hypothetical protein